MVWVSLLGSFDLTGVQNQPMHAPRGADLNMFRKLPQLDVYPVSDPSSQ